MSIVAVAFTVALAMAVLAIAWRRLRPSQKRLERLYRRPQSRFIEVEGVRLHFLDEGPTDGPVIVVLSAHWGSFASWDDWATALSDRYRIVRIDLPGHGLTGVFPSGDYSIDNYVTLLKAAIEQLQLKRFVLVGSSFSGIVAFQYAAQENAKITALILCNSSGMPRCHSAPQPNQPPDRWLHRRVAPIYRPRGFFRWKLSMLMRRSERITEERVRLYAHMNNRVGRIAEEAARIRQYKSSDPSKVLEQIKCPTLIQWGTHSPYLTVEDANQFEKAISADHCRKIIYQNAGHLIVEDVPKELAADVRLFLDDVWLAPEK